MPTKTVTFRAPAEKISTLDAIAELQQRDRSFLINEAVENYLSLYDYHRELIAERVRALDNGAETVDHEAAVEAIHGLSRKAKRKAS